MATNLPGLGIVSDGLVRIVSQDEGDVSQTEVGCNLPLRVAEHPIDLQTLLAVMETLSDITAHGQSVTQVHVAACLPLRVNRHGLLQVKLSCTTSEGGDRCRSTNCYHTWFEQTLIP